MTGAGRVAVVGLGLIGGSLARLLHARGVAVVATDVVVAAREGARRAGLAVTDDLADAVRDADVVVLAVPLRVMGVVAEQVAAAAPAHATVTDVGSVKGPVGDAVRAAGLGDRFVGAHPMAGTEHSGFEASSTDLLDGVAWAVTVPDPATVDRDRLTRVLTLVTGPLRGRAVVVTDDVHDEAAALVSHVPHVLATQLLNAVAGAPVRHVALGLAAGSFRDGTRVAFSDPARTEAMVAQNAGWVVPALRKVVRDLEVLVEALEANGPTSGFFHDADDVRAAGRPGMHAEARTRRERLASWGEWPAALVERCTAGAVVVAVDADGVDLEVPGG